MLDSKYSTITFTLTDAFSSYFSDVGLDSAFIAYVNEHQREVRNIHVSRCDPQQSDPQQLVVHSRRSVLAGFRNTDDKTYKFVEFVHILPPLQSLCLLFWGGWTHGNSLFWEQGRPLDPLKHRRVTTQELAMSGSIPQSFTLSMSQIFDLFVVTKLTLFDCSTQDFVTLSRAPELKNLAKLHFRTVDAMTLFDVADFHNLFERNHNLQHVFLSLEGLTAIPIEPQSYLQTHSPSAFTNFSPSYLSPLRQRLRTLSLFDPMWAEMQGTDAYPSVEFLQGPSLRYICREFGSLQQLGFQAPGQALLATSGAKISHDALMRYLVSAQCLFEGRLDTAEAGADLNRIQSKTSKSYVSYISTRTI